MSVTPDVGAVLHAVESALDAVAEHIGSSVEVRPSALPKLAVCPFWVGDSVAGPAAERGTVMDRAFRTMIAGEVECEEDMDDASWDAVTWAWDTALILSQRHPLESREAFLKAKAPGVNEGTADLLCEGARWSADLKSGQVRNYREQQAAYAIGFMERFFVDEWTVFLLFCDERQVIRLDYTWDSASEIVRGVLAKVRDPEARPVPCDYCGWCAKRWRCPERLETVAWFLRMDPATVDFEAAAQDPARVGSLLELTHQVACDDGLHDTLKKSATAHMVAGRPVAGWRLQNGKETKSVAAARAQEPINGRSLIDKAGVASVLQAVGTMSAAKFAKLWEAAGMGETVPPDWVEVRHGSAFAVKERAKK